MSLYHRADLGSDGRIAQIAGSYDWAGSQILTRFLQFYRSTFLVSDLATTSGFIPDLYDTNAPALHFLYSAFRPGERFDQVVKRSSGMRAIRWSVKANRTRSVLGLGPLPFLKQGHSATDSAGNVVSQEVSFNPVWVETGMLVGVKPDDVVNATSGMQSGRNAFIGRNVTASMGGGFMGEQSYLTGNNDIDGVPANLEGGHRIYRVWSKAIMKDALGITIPALRSSDVSAEVESASTFPWRKAASCQTCHSTIDELAGAIRNYVKLRTSDGVGRVGFWTLFQSGTQPEAPLPRVSGDSQYFNRPQKFILRFRGYDGLLQEYAGSGLSGLGAQIAGTKEFYITAAGRHYMFLTGISANLSDLSNPSIPQLSPSELIIRNRVIGLGITLQENQSIPALIQSILALPEYLDPSSISSGGSP